MTEHIPYYSLLQFFCCKILKLILRKMSKGSMQKTFKCRVGVIILLNVFSSSRSIKWLFYFHWYPRPESMQLTTYWCIVSFSRIMVQRSDAFCSSVLYGCQNEQFNKNIDKCSLPQGLQSVILMFNWLYTNSAFSEN